jgi:protein-L-isoaspartate(D-aspartate) O-methyltransferase
LLPQQVTALLASIAKEVTGVESDPSLLKQALINLDALKIKNAEVQGGPLSGGWKAKAPYDVIVINGSVDNVPEAIFSQLDEGGKLVVVVRQYGPSQAAHTNEARLYEKIRGIVSHRALFDANIKPLPGFMATPGFIFLRR